MNNADIIKLLSTMTSDARRENFIQVLNKRTRYITLVMEDLFQTHNASAVIRSCECFGIQDVHFVENSNRFSENPDITLGSAHWISKYRYNEHENNTLATINKLKKQGYRIVATTPHTNDVSLPDLNLEKGKIALLFGCELRGLSQIALDNADEFLRIPMNGFTESFNISVSAAICLYDIVSRLHKSNIEWQLKDDEKEIIYTEWLKKSVKDSKNIIKEIEKRANQQ